MNIETLLVLKKGRDKAARNRHHWIFSGAVASLPSEAADGDFVRVCSNGGDILGTAYLNRKSSIVARMVSFDEFPPLKAIEQNIRRACALRETFFSGADTNGYRLINGEGDGIPGLIVDKYDDLLVLQFFTLGMEKIKPFLLDILCELLKPVSIFERSDLSIRRREGLEPFTGFLRGEDKPRVIIRENAVQFEVDVLKGQKTGFYLDQREMRAFVRGLSKGRRVLNCFSYTGGFSVNAALGGAREVLSVDRSEEAMNLCCRNFELNGLDSAGHQYKVEDVFQFLRQSPVDSDLVILDPPAFAKKKKDIMKACRGYKDINRLAFEKIAKPGILVTCSCSHFVDETLFGQVVFEAASEAGVMAKIIGTHRLAPDHPINVYHPESHYLKSLVLYVE